MDRYCECESRDAYVDSILLSAPRRREQMIPLLQAVQTKFGYIPESAIFRIASHIKASPNEIYGVVTFYTQFRLKPQGKHTLKVCQGTACHVRGADHLIKTIKQELHVEPGETTPDGEYSVERAACFGTCGLAPVVVIDEDVFGKLTEEKLKAVLRQRKPRVAATNER